MTDWRESVINSRAAGCGQNEILDAVSVVGGSGIICGGDGVWAGSGRSAQISGDRERLCRARLQVQIGGTTSRVAVALQDAGEVGARCARARDECGADPAWNRRIRATISATAICRRIV